MSRRSKSASPNIYGPELWTTIRGEALSHWDLWFVVVMHELPHGKWELVDLLKRQAGKNRGSNKRDVESKLNHLLDLETRLLSAGLTHDDVLADVTIDYRLRHRADEKVLKRHVGAYPSPSMINTPRKILRERAMRGHWEKFASNPKTHEAVLGHKLVHPGGYYDYRATPLVAELLESTWERQRSMAASKAAKIALDRLAMTVIVELMEHVDDDGDMGPIFDAVVASYSADVWHAGIDPEVVLRDGIEFGCWEDYGLSKEMEAFFEAVPREHGDLAVQILAETRAELIINGRDYEHQKVLSMWATLLVAHERFDAFEHLAFRLGSDAWLPIVMMVDKAVAAGRDEVARAVLSAADQPGRHRDALRRKAEQLSQRAPASAASR